MQWKRIHLLPLFAVVLCQSACGGIQGGSTASEAPKATTAQQEEPPPAEAGARILADGEGDIEADDAASDRRAATEFAKTANLAAPTPMDVEVPVLLDYPHAEVVPQEGHRNTIEHIAISDNGRLVLTASKDNTFKLLTRSGATLLRTFHVDPGRISAGDQRTAAFLPDGRQALGLVGKTVYLWDTASGKQIQVFDLDRRHPRQMAFSPDGRQAAFVFGTNHFEIWNLAQGSLQKEFEITEPGWSGALLFSRDGRSLLSGHEDGAFRQWDLKSGKLLRTSPLLQSGVIDDARYLKDGNITAAGHTQNTTAAAEVVIWNPVSGDIVTETRSIPGRFNRLIVMQGEQRAVSDTDAQSLMLFDLTTGAKLRILRLSLPLSRPTFAPDGSCVISTDGEHNVHIFEIRTDAAPGGSDNNLFKPDKTFRAAAAGFGPSAVGFQALAAVSPGAMDTYIWDLHKGFMAQRVKLTYRRYGQTVALSPDGTRMINGNRLIDLTTSQEVGYLSREYRQISPVSAAFSPDGKRIAAVENDLGLAVWETSGADSLRTPVLDSRLMDATEGGALKFRQVVYSPDGRRLLVSGDRTLLLNANDLSLVRSYSTKTTRASFFPDGNHLILENETGAMLYTADGQGPLFVFRGEGSVTVSAALSPDGKRLAILSASNGAAVDTVTIWDTYKKEKLQVLRKANQSWRDIRFLSDSTHIITVGDQSLPRVWNLQNGRTAVLMTDGDEWAICTEDGYFDASRRGGYLLALVQGNRGFRVDQLSIKYNRPDVVLRDLGFGTPELSAHYYEMYKKRLRKMKIAENRVDEVLSTAPKAVIEKVEHKGKWVRLTASLSSEGSPLSRYNLYVNEVPIYGLAGAPIHGDKKRVEMVVELTDGINNLEVGVTNDAGLESLRDKYTACYTAEKQKHDLYYLGFGVSAYADANLNLKYAAKDARELSAVFREVYTGYKQVHSKVFTDDRVNLDAFIEAKLFLEKAGVDDTVVLFVAGHGLYDPDNEEDYYYLAHDTDIGRLKDTGVPFEAIEGLLSDIKPRRKLFLLDTCQSGELDEGAENEMLAMAGARGLLSRGIRKKNLIGHISSQKSLKKYLEERDRRFIYNDVTRRSGTMVISSSRGSEFSYEKDELQNGVFTEEVYNAFTSETADRNKDKFLSIDELRDFVFTAVSKETDGLQHPVVDRDNLELTFEFPIIKTAAPQ